MQVKPLLLSGCVALAACSGDTITGPNGESGSLSFSFTGAGGASSFNAAGAVPTGASTGYGASPWAIGSKDNANQIFDVLAAGPKTSTTWDIASVTIARLTVGSSAINCASEMCTGVAVLFGSAPGNNSYAFQCVLTTGTVTLAIISATRAVGTFSGSGQCIATSGATTPFAVANGAFDVGFSSGIG